MGRTGWDPILPRAPYHGSSISEGQNKISMENFDEASRDVAKNLKAAIRTRMKNGVSLAPISINGDTTHEWVVMKLRC